MLSRPCAALRVAELFCCVTPAFCAGCTAARPRALHKPSALLPTRFAMGDGALAAAAWNGAIPVCVSLDEHEVAAPQAPPSLFLLVPRHAYLPQLSDAAFAHFRDVLPPGDNELWFDAGGVPLKWQMPCGILHDLLAAGELPWRLRVHFRAFPEGVLTRCVGPETVRGHLFNSLKARTGRCLSRPCADVRPSPGGVLPRQRKRLGGADAALFSADGPVAGTSLGQRTSPWVTRANSPAAQGLLDHDFARYKRGAATLHASSRSGRCALRLFGPAREVTPRTAQASQRAAARASRLRSRRAA